MAFLIDQLQEHACQLYKTARKTIRVQSEFARHLDIPIQRINELIQGKRGITPGTAWLLSKAPGTSPEFWMNLQVTYELSSIDSPEGIKRLVA